MGAGESGQAYGNPPVSVRGDMTEIDVNIFVNIKNRCQIVELLGAGKFHQNERIDNSKLGLQFRR